MKARKATFAELANGSPAEFRSESEWVKWATGLDTGPNCPVDKKGHQRPTLDYQNPDATLATTLRRSGEIRVRTEQLNPGVFVAIVSFGHIADAVDEGVLLIGNESDVEQAARQAAMFWCLRRMKARRLHRRETLAEEARRRAAKIEANTRPLGERRRMAAAKLKKALAARAAFLAAEAATETATRKAS